MSDLTNIAARTQRFRDAVRAFTPPPRVRHAKLIPIKDGIVVATTEGHIARRYPPTSRSRWRRGQYRNDRTVSPGDEPQFSVSTTTSTIRSRTHPRSEFDPTVNCCRFVSERCDDRKVAAAAACR